VLDVGETVPDRSREYAAWAEFFGVPAHTFSAVFGAMIGSGASVKQVLEFFGAGRSIDQLRRERPASVPLIEADLYPDVRPAIASLRSRVRVAIAGNQPSDIGAQLRALDLGAELVASSTEWGVAKPRAEFFQRLCAELKLPGARVLYVGDQLGNDVAAPVAAGLAAVRIRRGPWGLLTHDPAIEARAVAVIDSLPELLSIVG
jgi:FMN phosphatase YigB (HAD superfamily)